LGLEADDTEGLLRALQIDTRVALLPYIGPAIHTHVPGRQVDPLYGIHTRWISNESGGYWDFCDFPLQTATLEEVNQWPMPSPDDFDYDAIKLQCAKYKDYCVVFGSPSWGDIINSTGMLRTMEQVMIDLAVNDLAGIRIFERKCAIQAQILERALKTAGGGIDLVWLGEDLGTQQGPLISLEMFRKYIRPQHQQFVDIAKTYNVPVMIHCCGSSSWAFDDFIEMGINVVDTLQPEANNMSPAYLKKKFGKKLAFHGSISTAGPMAYGGVEETIRNVKETLEVMMIGGGYIMAPTHAIQDNSPAENVFAAYNAVLRYGVY
jgi:uroporphyrinogen decarboxylase